LNPKEVLNVKSAGSEVKGKRGYDRVSLNDALTVFVDSFGFVIVNAGWKGEYGSGGMGFARHYRKKGEKKAVPYYLKLY
jgi:hypothetical protein